MNNNALQPINSVDSNVVETHIDFPAGMEVSERVGIDVTLLEDLCRYAGIARLTIRTISEEGSPQAIILGQDRNGAAHGGFIEIKDQSSSEITPLPIQRTRFRVNSWSSGNISLDMDAIIAEVQAGEKGLRDSKKWAEILNKKIKDELFKVGLKTSLQFEHKESIIFLRAMVFALISSAIIAIRETRNLSILLTLIQVLLAIQVVIKVDERWLKRLPSNQPKYGRNSIVNFLGAEIDRLVVFSCRLTFSTLVKEIVPQQEEE